MLAKFGLVLLTLVFGVVAFGAGLLFPASLRQDIMQIAKKVGQKLPGKDGPDTQGSSEVSTAPGNTTPPTSLSSPATAPANPASTPAAAASAPGFVPAGSLIVPTATTSSASFALQAAQFATEQSASQLASSIQMQGVTSTVVLMREPKSGSWSVVTVGRFASADEALSQRNYLSLKLGLPPNMSAIALPPPAK